MRSNSGKALGNSVYSLDIPYYSDDINCKKRDN